MKLATKLSFAAMITMVMLPAGSWATTEDVVVLGTGERVLEARAGADELRLLTPPKKQWLIRGLAKGDRITVSYEQDGEKKILSEVRGSGTVTGAVVNVEKVFITVEAEDGARHRLMPCWTGGMPKDGGGHDKSVLKRIRSVEKGQRVRLTWVIEEGKRVTDVTPLSKDRD